MLIKFETVYHEDDYCECCGPISSYTLNVSVGETLVCSYDYDDHFGGLMVSPEVDYLTSPVEEVLKGLVGNFEGFDIFYYYEMLSKLQSLRECFYVSSGANELRILSILMEEDGLPSLDIKEEWRARGY